MVQIFFCYRLITKRSTRLGFPRIECLTEDNFSCRRELLLGFLVQLRSKIPKLIFTVQAQILMMSSPGQWLCVGRCFQVCDLLVERLLIRYEQRYIPPFYGSPRTELKRSRPYPCYETKCLSVFPWLSISSWNQTKYMQGISVHIKSHKISFSAVMFNFV